MSLGLLGAYVSDSDSSDDDDDNSKATDGEKNKDETDEHKETLLNPFMSGSSSIGKCEGWLPKPSFMQESEKVSGLKFDSSVFSNPFRAKEDKKDAILEQHVEMTHGQSTGRTINGKKVCWNFRKGRCRHGHKCSFAHDSDVKNSIVDSLYTPKYDSGAQMSFEKAKTNTVQPIQMTKEDPEEDIGVSEETNVGGPKKKRPGLCDSLVPSKKAMKFHNKV